MWWWIVGARAPYVRLGLEKAECGKRSKRAWSELRGLTKCNQTEANRKPDHPVDHERQNPLLHVSLKNFSMTQRSVVQNPFFG
jgi:hypothetical protein